MSRTWIPIGRADLEADLDTHRWSFNLDTHRWSSRPGQPSLAPGRPERDLDTHWPRPGKPSLAFDLDTHRWPPTAWTAIVGPHDLDTHCPPTGQTSLPTKRDLDSHRWPPSLAPTKRDLDSHHWPVGPRRSATWTAIVGPHDLDTHRWPTTWTAIVSPPGQPSLAPPSLAPTKRDLDSHRWSPIVGTHQARPGQPSLARSGQPSLVMWEQIGSILPKLGLESVAATSKGCFLEDQPIEEIVTALHTAASYGGAYSPGAGAAIGRLLTWQSMAGLTGAPESASIEEIANRASDCKWSQFYSTSTWFNDIAWDIGIACAVPETDELTVLAATDLD